MGLWIAPRLERLSGQARRAAAFGQGIMRHMIVKDDIACAAARNERLEPRILLKQMGLKPQLQFHIRQKPRLVAQGGGKRSAKSGPRIPPSQEKNWANMAVVYRLRQARHPPHEAQARDP